MIHDHMTLTECHTASIHLDGLIQAIDVLDGDSTPQAFEGRGALLAVIGQHADALSSSLDRLDMAANASDPILTPYRRWWEAYLEFGRLSQEGALWESPEMVALSETRDEAREQVEDMQPVTMAGIAAVAHVAWATDAMPWAEGSEGYLREAERPFCKMLAAIWRLSSGKPGLPPC
jgi:hypothetical protein